MARAEGAINRQQEYILGHSCHCSLKIFASDSTENRQQLKVIICDPGSLLRQLLEKTCNGRRVVYAISCWLAIDDKKIPDNTPIKQPTYISQKFPTFTGYAIDSKPP